MRAPDTHEVYFWGAVREDASWWDSRLGWARLFQNLGCLCSELVFFFNHQAALDAVRCIYVLIIG